MICSACDDNGWLIEVVDRKTTRIKACDVCKRFDHDEEARDAARRQFAKWEREQQRQEHY